jgi:hypothetical protein
MNLQENIQRIKSMMGLKEQSTGIKAKASLEGLINFFDLENEKVYRYEVVAKVDDEMVLDIFVKSLDDTTGDMVYLDPQDESEETYTIPIEELNQIKEKSPLKKDINNIFSFKKLTKTIEINLIFVEESVLRVMK